MDDKQVDWTVYKRVVLMVGKLVYELVDVKVDRSALSMAEQWDFEMVSSPDDLWDREWVVC